jgi:uncharacterized membrane protein YadS
MQSKQFLLASGVVLLFTTLACEPVIAIGWRELSCIFLLMAFLFGPPLYRLIRRVEKFRKSKDE